MSVSHSLNGRFAEFLVKWQFGRSESCHHWVFHMFADFSGVTLSRAYLSFLSITKIFPLGN